MNLPNGTTVYRIKREIGGAYLVEEGCVTALPGRGGQGVLTECKERGAYGVWRGSLETGGWHQDIVTAVQAEMDLLDREKAATFEQLRRLARESATEAAKGTA